MKSWLQWSALITTLSASLLLSACLSPQERTEIYGGQFSKSDTPQQTKATETVRKPAPRPAVHQSPKPSPAFPALRPNGDQSMPNPPAPKAPPMARATDDACHAKDHKNLLGKPLSSLNSMRFSQPLRIIMPGQMITQDHSPQRLNIEINNQSIIVGLRCG